MPKFITYLQSFLYICFDIVLVILVDLIISIINNLGG